MTISQILYIMGTGRTGTTILEVLLKNSEGVFGTGELTHIFRDGYLADRTCSCGVPASGCEVWRTVRNLASWSDEDVRGAERVLRRVESHARFPLVAGGLSRSPTNSEYNRINLELYEAVGKATGANVIVDSSKYAGRALALARAIPSLRVICITRSPAGLIATYRKPNRGEQRPQSAAFVFVYYAYVLACMRVVRTLLGSRCLTIRYEDLREDPRAVLERIAHWSGIDFSASLARLDGEEPLDVGHIVTGNRLRRQGRVHYRTGRETKTVSGIGSRTAAWLLRAYRTALGF